MPTIPLLKTSTDLAMPQVPALDQVKRPSIDVRGVLAAMENLGNASMRRPVDAEPFVQAAGAKGKAMGSTLESVGSALTDVSSVLGALAQKRVQESNRLGIYKAQSAMQAGTQEVQDHFDQNPDKPEGFVHHALAVGGKVLKGLGHIIGLDHWGHHSVTQESRTWHRELVAGAQVASDKQIFRNSADAQVAQFNGLMDKGRVKEGGAMLPVIRNSHVVNEKDLVQMGQRLVEVGSQQEVGKLYAAMREPGFTLEKGNRMVEKFEYVPNERRPQVKADLSIAHAEFTEKSEVVELTKKDPRGALAALADGSKFAHLKPGTKFALVKAAKEAREGMGTQAYAKSIALVEGLNKEQLGAMTPRKLEEAMAGGKVAALWAQAEPFHKKLVRHYLALKQGHEQLNDPEARLALEAAIDHHVPDLNGPVEAAHLRMSIDHGFDGAMHDELMKRLDGRKNAKVPAVTSDARALIGQLAYRDNAIGEVRVPMKNAAGAPLYADADEGDSTGRGYIPQPGQEVQAGKLLPMTQRDEKVKVDVDREATILTRMLEEQVAKKDGGIKSAADAVRFVRDTARARGWQLPEEQADQGPLGKAPVAVTVAEVKKGVGPDTNGLSRAGTSMKGPIAGEAITAPPLEFKVQPPGSVLAAESPEMLAARRPAVTKNDPAMKGETIAASAPYQSAVQPMKAAYDAGTEPVTDVPHITLTFSDGFRKTIKMPNRSRAEVEARAEQIRGMPQSTPEEDASFNGAVRQRMLELRLLKDPEASLDDVSELKPAAKVVHVSTNRDEDHIEGIPVDFSWYPSEEKLKTTVRLGDYPQENRSKEDIDKRAKWRENFKNTYGSMAVNAAWQNKVPARLLTVLAANEMAAPDWGPFASFVDRAGLGKSTGPLQITGKTAVKEGAAHDEREVAFGSLNEPGRNFDVGGRLLRVYLLRLAEDVAEGRHLKYSESFKVMSTLNISKSQIYDDLKQIREGSPDKIFSLKPSDGLVAALGAIWNNGYEIVHVKDIAKNAGGGYAHAYTATEFKPWAEELMPRISKGDKP